MPGSLVTHGGIDLDSRRIFRLTSLAGGMATGMSPPQGGPQGGRRSQMSPSLSAADPLAACATQETDGPTVAVRSRGRRFLVGVATYASVLLVSLAVMVLATRLWRVDLRIP